MNIERKKLKIAKDKSETSRTCTACTVTFLDEVFFRGQEIHIGERMYKGKRVNVPLFLRSDDFEHTKFISQFWEELPHDNDRVQTFP